MHSYVQSYIKYVLTHLVVSFSMSIEYRKEIRMNELSASNQVRYQKFWVRNWSDWYPRLKLNSYIRMLRNCIWQIFDKYSYKRQSFVFTLQIFIKVHLRSVTRRFVDKLVLLYVNVCIYLCVTGFQFDRRVTYSERRARSEWKLYQARLRCVKGAIYPIRRTDCLSMFWRLCSSPNGKQLCNSVRGILLIHFYIKCYHIKTGIAMLVAIKHECNIHMHLKKCIRPSSLLKILSEGRMGELA